MQYNQHVYAQTKNMPNVSRKDDTENLKYSLLIDGETDDSGGSVIKFQWISFSGTLKI